MRFASYLLLLIAGGFTLGVGAKLTYLLALNPVIEVPRIPSIIDGVIVGLTGGAIIVYSFIKVFQIVFRRAK